MDKSIELLQDISCKLTTVIELLTKQNQPMEAAEIKMFKPAKKDLPEIVYTIDLGQLKAIMNAPQDAFSEAFLNKMRIDLPQIVNPHAAPLAPDEAETRKRLAEEHIARQKSKHN